MHVNILLGNECAQWTYICIFIILCMGYIKRCSGCIREDVYAILKESDKHIKFC